MIKCALQTNTIQIKHNKVRIPTGWRLTSWLFTGRGGVEFGATEDKSSALPLGHARIPTTYYKNSSPIVVFSVCGQSLTVILVTFFLM